MTTEEEVRRGLRAQALLADPLVADAFAALDSHCIEEWRRAGPRDVETRERLWLMLKLTERLKQHFASLVEDGRLAGERIAALEKERKLKLFGRS